MFTVKEILIPRSKGSNLVPFPIDRMEKPFEDMIGEALFSFPYKPDNYYYVINVLEETGEDDFLLIIDPDLSPVEGEMFVSVIDDVPVVRKFDPRFHRNLNILGTVAHATKAGSVSI